MEISEAQRRAIYHNTGPALVLAGPGSGKTTVITHRINTLIDHYHVDPSNILVITFTKAAATEMKERFLKLSDNRNTAVAFGTFHAVYFTILKHSYHYQSDCIIHPEKQAALIQEILAPYELETEDENELVQQVLSEVSQVKNGRLSIEEFQSMACPENTFRKVYSSYQHILKKKRLIDFDDMLLNCYALLTDRADILAAWQNKYRYILIDEFQDINQVQFDVIACIAEKYRNIFVVGDDDQSIYGFRGSKPKIMRNFENVYPEAVRMELVENYRSGKKIVSAASSVIGHNADRFFKNIVSANGRRGSVEIHEVCRLEDEYTFVINKIISLHEKGIKYEDMAVLYRINSIGAVLSGKMLLEGVPCEWRMQEQQLYDHWIAKDIIAYIQAAHGNMSRENILRIINKPMRYITRSYLSEPVSLEGLKQFYEHNIEMQNRICNLQFDLSMIQKMTTFAAINYIRKAVDYDRYIEEFARKHHDRLETLQEVIEEITEQSKKYNRIGDWMEYIEKYGQEVERARADSRLRHGVHMQTMHGAKGLEFQIVFILDFNEGMIPYHKAVLPEEIEEERRMFYVAMTRAKDYLCIVFTRERYNKKMTVSRFLGEIEPQSSCIYHLEADQRNSN